VSGLKLGLRSGNARTVSRVARLCLPICGARIHSAEKRSGESQATPQEGIWAYNLSFQIPVTLSQRVNVQRKPVLHVFHKGTRVKSLSLPSSEAAYLRAGCGQTRTSISSILSRHICERDLPASLESTEFRPTELFESTDVCEGPRHRSAPHTRELRLPIDQ
jgi:hypothetical protein